MSKIEVPLFEPDLTEADKQAELRKLERLIDQLKKELITQEEYTFALRELKL